MADARPHPLLSDLRAAFAFLTLLPVRTDSARSPGHAFAWFPLVGLTIGGLLAAVGWLPLAEPLRSFLLLAVWVGISGGLHLDGWADSCDGLWVTAAPERRLEIMKDPRTGAWAVIGLVLLLLGKFAALYDLLPILLVAAPVAGRWAMVLAASAFPYARAHSDGEHSLGGWFREGLGRRELQIATVSAIVIVGGAAWFDVRALWAFAAALIVAFGFGRWAARRLGGGLTGDVYGAVCELTELLCVLGFALMRAW